MRYYMTVICLVCRKEMHENEIERHIEKEHSDKPNTGPLWQWGTAMPIEGEKEKVAS